MLSMPGTPPQPRSIPRRPVRMPAGDPLDEFADEQEARIAPLPPTPRAALFRHDPMLVRQDVVALEPRPHTKREVVVRVQVPMSRLGATLAAAGLAMSGLAALFATALVVTPDRGPAPPPYIVPSPSPIEIEYPDYPGAPPLRTASTAVPAHRWPTRWQAPSVRPRHGRVPLPLDACRAGSGQPVRCAKREAPARLGVGR